jgi:hypothetical protein
MPNIEVPKESLEGLPPLPAGIHQVRLDDFKPEMSKKGDSINLHPVMKVVNNPQLMDRNSPWENLNNKAGWVMKDFVHAFGQTMAGPDKNQLPGMFVCKEHGTAQCECKPDKWNYVGPLKGQIGSIEVVQVDNGKGNGGTKPAIKRYICRVPGCTEKHSESLL